MNVEDVEILEREEENEIYALIRDADAALPCCDMESTCQFFMGGEGGDIWNRITLCLQKEDLTGLEKLLAEERLDPNLKRFWCGYSIPSIISGFDLPFNSQMLDLLLHHGADLSRKVTIDPGSSKERDLSMCEFLKMPKIARVYPNAKRILEHLELE